MKIFWGGGAEGGTRTLTLSLAADFESAASTNSATSAKDLLIIKIWTLFVNIKLQNCKATLRIDFPIFKISLFKAFKHNLLNT